MGGARWLLGGLAVASVLALAGCRGENRPNVEIIGGASASVSGADDPALNANSGARYTMTTQQDLALQASLDLRDLRIIINPALDGRPVEWERATALYAQGKNQRRADGTIRPLASLAAEPMPAAFPDAARVYGREGFLDAMIREGLSGTGRAQGLGDNARREIVDRGVQAVLYGQTLQQLALAQSRAATKDAGAAAALDAAWAFAAGAPDSEGARAYALIRTASEREADFKLTGRIAKPLEERFIAAREAIERGDGAAAERAIAEVRGTLNAVAVLSTLRPARPLSQETDAADRRVLLEEGRSAFAAIRAQVAAASADAAQAVEAAYDRPADQAFPPDQVSRVYAALNDPAVVRALAIPPALQVKTAPTQ
ncbi:MAG: hypothetical protein AB7G21_10950 [Dehalococcoidia bacterium]